MSNNILIIIISFSLPFLGNAQDIQEDKEAIKAMCGCYEVKFNFAEVYSPDLGYDLKEPYQSQATELITLIEESEDEVSMQHILQVSDEMIIKHWRQDWKYEDEKLLQYDVASSWDEKVISKNEAEGSWTQSVYQVDDSPRYEAYGKWVHKDTVSYWEGVSDAPLPRRDLKSRDDYNVMQRRNRHSVMSENHIHEEDNTKINRSARYGDEVIAIEKGYNTYTKVDDSRCAAAREWWQENQKFWDLVRAEWNNLPLKKGELTLDFENGKNSEFYMAMFGLNKKHIEADKFDAVQAQKDIRELMEQYQINSTESTSNQ